MSEDPILTRAKALSAADDHAGAARAFEQMAGAARQAGDPAGAAAALDFASREWWSASEIDAAHGALKERLSLLRALGDSHEVALALVGLAFFPMHDSGKLAYWNEAKQLAQEHGFSDVLNQIRSREDVARLTGRSIEDLLGRP